MNDMVIIALIIGMIFALLFGISNTRMYFLKKRTEAAIESLNLSKRIVQIMAIELENREVDVNELVNTELSRDE